MEYDYVTILDQEYALESPEQRRAAFAAMRAAKVYESPVWANHPYWGRYKTKIKLRSAQIETTDEKLAGLCARALEERDEVARGALQDIGWRISSTEWDGSRYKGTVDFWPPSEEHGVEDWRVWCDDEDSDGVEIAATILWGTAGCTFIWRGAV